MSDNEIKKIEMQKKLDKLNENIRNIKSQLAEYYNGNPKNRSYVWRADAGKALVVSQNKAGRLKREIAEICTIIKDEHIARSQTEAQIKCKLFYNKLKELMPYEALKEFLEDCDREIREAAGFEN